MYQLYVCDFFLIQKYLECNDYIKFINTTKKFRFIKKLTVYYKLNLEYSNKYYHDDQFRHRIHKNIYCPLLQISVVYLFNHKIFNCERIMTHKVVLIYCSNIVNVLPLIYSNTVIIYGCNGIKNILPLLLNSCIQNLQIKSCAKLNLTSEGLTYSC